MALPILAHLANWAIGGTIGAGLGSAGGYFGSDGDWSTSKGPSKEARSGSRKKVSKRQTEIINKFEKLGIDFDSEEAKKNPDYVNSVYKQIHAKLAAAGVKLEGTRQDGKTKFDKDNLDHLIEAYDNLSDEAKQKYAAGPSKVQESKADASGVGPGGQEISNGTRQVSPQQSAATPAAPLAPRRPQPPSQVSAGSTNRYGTKADDSGVYVNGAPVSRNDDATLYNVKDAQRETTQREAIEAAEDRKDAQTRAQSGTRRRTQQYYADQDALDRSMNERRERKRAEREAADQRRRDKRYENRTLTNRADWENLGRAGSNRRDYAPVANETDAQRKDREAAVADRDKSIKALQDRFAQLSDRTLLKKGETYSWEGGKPVVKNAQGDVVDAAEVAARKDSGVGQSEYSYANSFYANDPNRQRELSGLSALVGKAAEGKTITDAQIEAANKTLDSWEAEANERGARVQAFQNMNNAEQVSNLRRQYGLLDKSITPDEVMQYHADQQKAARTEILKGMQAAPGLTPDQTDAGGTARQSVGKSAMTKFSQQWQQLLDNGFDPQATFAKAMENPENKKAYLEGMRTISNSDSDAADKRDQLRRRFIMQQAMEESGLAQAGGESGQPGARIATADSAAKGVPQPPASVGKAMAKNLPGSKVLMSRGEAEANHARMDSLGGPESLVAQDKTGDLNGALRPKQPPGMTIVHSAQEARDAANAINQQVATNQQAQRTAARENALNDNTGMANYQAIVDQNKKKEGQQLGDMKGGVTSLRPRRVRHG